MPERIKLMAEWLHNTTLLESMLIYMTAMFSGAVGGLAVASNKHIRRKQMIAFTWASMIVLGLFSGLLSAAWILAGYPLFGLVNVTSFHEVVVWSILSGFLGTVILASVNLSVGVLAVVILRRMGVPVELTSELIELKK